MKFAYACFLISIVLLCSSSIFAFSQQTDVLRIIPLSSSTSLIIKRITEPITNPGGPAPQLPPGVIPLSLTRIKETYIVVLQTGTSEVDLDRAEFKSIEGVENSVMPRFAVYDAVLDGNTLHYLFTKKGEVYLARATVNVSGKVSGYHQSLTPNTFLAIQDAHFVKDHQGRTTLRIRKMGKKTDAFQFDSSGEAVSVPADQISSTSAQ